MIDNSRIEILNSKLTEWGASKFGYSFVKDVVPAKYSQMPYAISIVIHLVEQVVDEIDDAPTYTYFHHYRSVNTLIDDITLKTALLLQQWGYKALPVPASQTVHKDVGPYSGIFQHKTAATKAGLGWIGRNCLLITFDYGPRVRLGTVLTDMELPVGMPVEDNMCKDCTLCIDACPAKALYGGKWSVNVKREELLDPMACSEYMKKNFKHIGRGSVCGICMKVCPHNGKISQQQSPPPKHPQHESQI